VQEAGGFINTADDVVEAYTLPRTVYGVSDLPRDNSKMQGLNADSQESGDIVSLAVSALPLKMETFDIDDDLEIEHEQSDAANLGGVPKTMRELAETVGEHQTHQDDVAQTEDIVVSTRAPQHESLSSITPDRKRRPNTRANNSTTTTAMNRPKPVRGRKRNHREVESDSEDEYGTTTSKTGQDRDERDTPNRSRRTSKMVPTLIPASDRVLRTRKSKTAAQL
jgi:hypothetical protein